MILCKIVLTPDVLIDYELTMSWTNDQHAYTLANTYGLCLPWLAIPKSLIELDYGKYEPDHNNGAEQRFMILAQPLDATNILVLYKPADLPI